MLKDAKSVLMLLAGEVMTTSTALSIASSTLIREENLRTHATPPVTGAVAGFGSRGEKSGTTTVMTGLRGGPARTSAACDDNRGGGGGRQPRRGSKRITK